MMYSHPPSEQIRQTITDFKADARPNATHPTACACCQGPKPKSDLREVKIVAAIAFAVILGLVALSAHQRDQVDSENYSAPSTSLGGSIGANIGVPQVPALHQMNSIDLGPGASQAAELSFPTKTPIQQSTMFYAPVQQQHAVVPMQSIRPSEPALQIVAVPFNDGKGNVVHRLKRVVGR